jgi:hypothetical protein
MTPEQQRALAIARARLRVQQQQRAQQPVPNADGTYGEAPEGMVMNPTTGQMTSRELLKGNMETSTGGAAGRGAMAGLTFNLDDEAQAAGAYMRGGEDLALFRLEQARAQQELDQDQHGAASMAGQIGGALVPAIGSAPLAVGKGLLGTVGRGMGIGAVEGAAFGAGSGEGLGGRIDNAAWGGAIGGGVGAAAPAIMSAAKSVVAPAWGALTSQPSKTKVSRALAETLRQSGRSADDVAKDVRDAALEGQGEFRLMDALGDAGQRRASGMVRAGGDAATELADFLEKRQLGQPERMASFIDDAFDMGGDTAKSRAAALTAARGQAADAAYDAARGNAAPVDVRRALGVIDDRIGGMQGRGVAGDGIDAKLARYRNRLAAPESKLPEGEIARELSDFDRVLGVKQAVQDDIGAAVRAGRNNEARELGKLVSALDDALQDASPSYRSANDSFRDASGVIDAIDQGRKMSRSTNRAADTTAQFSAMTPEQQAAARVGYGDSLLGKLESGTAPTTNRAKALQSPKVEAERGILSIDPDLLARRVERENAMWGTQNRALGGSRTADNLADIEGAEQVTEGLLGSLESLGNINAGTAIKKALGSLGPALRGENEATRKALAEALLSSDPAMVLSPALRREFEMGLLDALGAAGGRQYGREGLLDMSAR